jgi:2-oxoglutarate ferredoxin oxidoreductase subunit delta
MIERAICIPRSRHLSRGRISIEQNRCKGCTLCTTVCPQNVLEIDHSKLNAIGYHPARLVDPDGDCTGCAVCALICPDACITVFRAPVRHATARA